MPKVLRIINRFNLGGPTLNVAYLTKYLSSDFETMLVGGVKEESEGSSEFIVRNLGIEPVVIPELQRSLNPSNDLIAYRKISRIIKEFKPDIVHTHASKAGTIGRLAAMRQKVPVIVHTFHGHVFHSYFNQMKSNIFMRIEKELASRTTKIIAISDKQKEELSVEFKIADPERFEVIPLGFDLSKFQENQSEKREAFRKKFKLKDKDIAIGIIGRLAPVKNHKLFIDAIRVLKYSTLTNVKAFIIGDGELRTELEQYCASCGLKYDSINASEDVDVVFTSWIKDVHNVYPGLDIIAMTSLNEGTPVSLIEAQAANKPIITTNVGGIENIVLPDETAILSQNNNLKDFATKLKTLVESSQLQQKLSLSGWEFVQKRFHYQRLVEDMEQLYYKLLQQSNGKS